jgi:hypothetical protein
MCGKDLPPSLSVDFHICPACRVKSTACPLCRLPFRAEQRPTCRSCKLSFHASCERGNCASYFFLSSFLFFLSFLCHTFVSSRSAMHDDMCLSCVFGSLPRGSAKDFLLREESPEPKNLLPFFLCPHKLCKEAFLEKIQWEAHVHSFHPNCDCSICLPPS